MTNDVQFSSPEHWSEISDFPGYSISNQGRVLNTKFDRIVKPTVNSVGVVMIGLMHAGRQYKRSLALLVATEFVPQPQDMKFDTPIHLDGDRSNNRHTNLMWRPLWFARKYMRQFDEGICFNNPIEDIETGEVYKHSMNAAVYNGLLDKHIRIAMLTNGYVWPTGQVFREAIIN